ncbi:MAG: LysR family transcriptional regulator [Pseudomonadota bacterium]
MNWQAVSFDWNQVRAFLATAEEGSFSGAARALGSTQPTVGRQVSGLEESLGVTLFERTVRGPMLTEAGQDLLAHAQAMGEAATLVSVVASGKSQEVTGQVTVTSSDLMAATVLPPIFLELQKTAPGIRIEIVASSEFSNLSQREADIAIRHVRPEQPDLIARHLGDFRANFYAASAYLEKAGRPRTLQELAEHRFVGTSNVERMVEVLQARGIPVRLESFVAYTGSGAAMWEMTRAGLGICLVPDMLGDGEPTVERAVPGVPSIEFPIWLVTHRELRTSRRIRVVYDALARGLKAIAPVAREG